MKLFDSHLHLSDAAFAEDLDEAIARARAAGVHGMVTVASNPADAREAAGHSVNIGRSFAFTRITYDAGVAMAARTDELVVPARAVVARVAQPELGRVELEVQARERGEGVQAARDGRIELAAVGLPRLQILVAGDARRA